MSPGIEWMNSIFWMWLAVIIGVVALVGFLVYRYYLEPPIARQFTSLRWKKFASVGFIQDDSNTVHLVTTDTELPEGVIHTKRGWFLRSRAPYMSHNRVEEKLDKKEVAVRVYEQVKADLLEKGIEVSDEALNVMVKDKVDALLRTQNGDNGKRGRGRPPKTSEVEDEDYGVYEDGLKTVLQAPVLAGLGRSVFFGYEGAPLVGNLKTLALTGNNAVEVTKESDDKKSWRVTVKKVVAHADMRILKEIIPATISRTQLAALHNYSLNKGYLKRGGDQMKLIFIAIAAAIPLGVMGLVVYLILNGA